MPACHELRTLGQLIFEPAECAVPSDSPGERSSEVCVVDVVDEQLHVLVARTRPLGRHPQPAVVVLVLVDAVGIVGVLDRGLGPDLAGAQVDAASAMDGVTLKRRGQLK